MSGLGVKNSFLCCSTAARGKNVRLGIIRRELFPVKKRGSTTANIQEEEDMAHL